MISATSNELSGTRHRSTSPEASVACSAMKPECLPINLTIPIPFGQASASVLAASIMGMAASTALVNPKELSINGTCVDALPAASVERYLAAARAWWRRGALSRQQWALSLELSAMGLLVVCALTGFATGAL